MPRKSNTDKLVVTNYNNFKNADFFIKQYFKAQEMLKEVNEFFNSFSMSKLMTSSQLMDVHPNMYITEYSSPWTEIFTNYDLRRKCVDYELLSGQSWRDKKMLSAEEKAGKLKEVREATRQLCDDIALKMVEDFDCYFVLDQKNNLHEFIPVKSAETIRTNFTKKEIIISGYYYHYHEWGADFDNAKSSMDKIVKKIIIDPVNNNIKDVKENRITISEGNANGNKHDNYCLTALDGKNKVSTNQWDDVLKDMAGYRHELLKRDYFIWLKTPEEIEDFRKKLHMKYGSRYKKIFKKELTDDILIRYFDILKK